MADVVAVGTYLPPWVKGNQRSRGPDEDGLTMAVAAGRVADPTGSATRVVLVSRDFPLLEGGNGAVLLAGLSLEADVPVAEVLGGAPAVLDQILTATPGTLVVAADDNDAAVGAAAVLIGESGAALTAVGRQTRSLPLQARTTDGVRHTYVDSRLQREVGVKSTLARIHWPGTPAVVVVAGVKAAQLGRGFDVSAVVDDPAASAAAVIRLIADAIAVGKPGIVLAVEQSSVTAAELRLDAGSPRIIRDEVSARELPKVRVAEGTGIPISLPAYSRAFEPKLRWEAAVFEERPGIDAAPMFPPRARVDSAGVLATTYRLQPLPRTGTVYTHTTVQFPVPDLPSPYSLAVVQLDDCPVRVLLKITGVAAGEVAIDQPGSVVLRKIATRAGIPDYGYAFWPGKQTPQGVSA
jgi:uncharacterized OB-fold protein